jgi:hypothetical protein
VSRPVLVVSHADADGHVIAEQVRRNLESVSSFKVTTLVDPVRTKDHKAWTRLDEINEIESSDWVFFVDLMFAPSSFETEASALVKFANDRPSKMFFVLDHHPLPLRRLSSAPNVRAVYRQDVLDCTWGTASWLMVVAALCEKQPTRAKKMKSPILDVLVKGIRRAAAPGGSLSGEKLSALMRFDQWDGLVDVGREESAEHRLPRGRRDPTETPSKAMARLDMMATDLIKAASKRRHQVGKAMSYDFGSSIDLTPPTLDTPAAQPKDLEAIVMLLELAAIYLTTSPGASFTEQQLLAQAQAIGGDEIKLDPADIKIVLGKSGFLKKTPDGRYAFK